MQDPNFIIDWDFSSAEVQDANGGTGVLILKNLDVGNKEIFKKILLTFKFTK